MDEKYWDEAVGDWVYPREPMSMREMARLGGKASAAKLSAAERRERARKGGLARVAKDRARAEKGGTRDHS